MLKESLKGSNYFLFSMTRLSQWYKLKISFFSLSFILVEVLRIWTVAVYYSQLWPVILISFMTPKGSWPTWSKPRLPCVTGYLFTCKLGTRPPGMKILWKVLQNAPAVILRTCIKLPPAFKTLILSILSGRLRYVWLYINDSKHNDLESSSDNRQHSLFVPEK